MRFKKYYLLVFENGSKKTRSKTKALDAANQGARVYEIVRVKFSLGPVRLDVKATFFSW